MTHEEHRKRHVLLHQMLDELLADWIACDPAGVAAPVEEHRLPSYRTVTDLMRWSYQQTFDPELPRPFGGRSTPHRENGQKP